MPRMPALSLGPCSFLPQDGSKSSWLDLALHARVVPNQQLTSGLPHDSCSRGRYLSPATFGQTHRGTLPPTAAGRCFHPHTAARPRLPPRGSEPRLRQTATLPSPSTPRP